MAKSPIGIALTAIFVIGLTVFSAVTVPASSAEMYGPSSSGSSFYGGGSDDGAYCIQATSGNGLIIAGYTRSSGAGESDMWLLHLAPAIYTMDNGVSGTYLRENWNKTYGGTKNDGAFSVVQTSDDGFAVAGFTSSFGAGGNDSWLVKTASDGTPVWNMTYGGSKNDVANCLIQTSDGGYLLAGFTNSGVPSQSTWIIKTDAAGKMQWSKILQGICANSVVMTSDGGYALAVEYHDAFGLIILDSEGNQTASQRYVMPNDTASTQAIVQTDDGGYALAGWIANNTGARSTWLIKTDASGQEQWSQTYAGLGAYDLTKTTDGGYALTGDRAFLIITDSQGNVEWNKNYDGESGDGSQYFTRMQSLLETSPNHFNLAGVQDGGPYVHLQANWVQIALKSGAQLIPPETTILSPTNTTYDTRDVPLTFYVNEPTRFLGCSVNGVSNITISGNTTLTNLPDGAYSITVLATDYDYNHAASQTVFFNVKSDDPVVVPKVTIQSPTNQTYNTKQMSLSFSVDTQALWTVYSLDGGANRTAIPNMTSNMVFFTTSGTHTLTVYAGQIPDGPAGSETVSFAVSPNTEPAPYNRTYPTVDQQAGQQINQYSSEIIGFFASPTFLLIATALLVAAVSIVFVIVIFARKTLTQKQSSYKAS